MKNVVARGIAITAAILSAGAAFATETTTYSYDALGRLTAVAQSGGPNNGVNTTYSMDAAGNRTNVTVTGSSNGKPIIGWVVVPLNGYTLVPITE